MLQFNLERRDRRRREYVLMEEGDSESIMEILRPIVQQNESTVSMGNRLEVCICAAIVGQIHESMRQIPFNSVVSFTLVHVV